MKSIAVVGCGILIGLVATGCRHHRHAEVVPCTVAQQNHAVAKTFPRPPRYLPPPQRHGIEASVLYRSLFWEPPSPLCPPHPPHRRPAPHAVE